MGGCHGHPNTCFWDTSVLGRASLNEDRPPLSPLPCSRQRSLTIRFTHTPSRSLKVHLPNKRLLFYLTVPLMLTSSTTLQFVQHPYKKISITFFSSQLGKLRHREAGCFSKVMEAQEHGGTLLHGVLSAGIAQLTA